MNEALNEPKRIDATKAGRHYQLPDGRLVPSVTNVIDNTLPKPALMWWAANEERAACLNAIERVSQKFPDIHDPAAIRALVEAELGEKKAHQKKKRAAGDIGTEAHSVIEWQMKRQLGVDAGPEPQVSEPALLAVMAFEDWAKEVQLEPLFVERIVWSDFVNAAGTLDLAARMTWGGVRRTSVFDWKTGKAIYFEAKVQVATYRAFALERGYINSEIDDNGEVIDNCMATIVRLPKKLDDPSFETLTLEPDECHALAAGFEDVLKVWEFLQTWNR